VKTKKPKGNMNNAIEEEAIKLEQMNHMAITLIRYARSLHPEGFYLRNDNQPTTWINRPHNFVAFTIKPPLLRVHVLNLSVDSYPPELCERLPLRHEGEYFAHYVHFDLTDYAQLADALEWIRLSRNAPHPKRPRTADVAL
jgi:hypothetical protein